MKSCAVVPVLRRGAAPLFHGVTVVGLVLALAGCRAKAPDPHTPEGTLQLFRDALAGTGPAIETVADTRILEESRILYEGAIIGRVQGIPLLPGPFQQRLRDGAPRMDPAQSFRGVLPMLGQGRCVRIAEVRPPDELRQIAEMDERWSQEIKDLHASVARRLRNAVAGDYRCDPGLSFMAVFVHPHPDDGTLRVALIGASSHR